MTKQIQMTLDFDPEAQVRNLPNHLRKLAETISLYHITAPVPARQLARMVETDLRGVGRAVRELILTYRLPIGSTRGGKGGYFAIRTHEELETACRLLHETALDMLSREAALKKISLPSLLGQMQFENLGREENRTLAGASVENE